MPTIESIYIVVHAYCYIVPMTYILRLFKCVGRFNELGLLCILVILSMLIAIPI